MGRESVCSPFEQMPIKIDTATDHTPGDSTVSGCLKLIDMIPPGSHGYRNVVVVWTGIDCIVAGITRSTCKTTRQFRPAYRLVGCIDPGRFHNSGFLTGDKHIVTIH